MSLAWVRPMIRGSSHDRPYSAGKLNRPFAAVNFAFAVYWGYEFSNGIDAA